MINKLSIKYRIYCMGAFQFVLLLLISTMALSQMVKIGYELMDIAEEDIPLTKKVTYIIEHQLEQSVMFERVLLKYALRDAFPEEAKELNELEAKLSKLIDKTSLELTDAKSFSSKAMEVAHSEKAKKAFNAVTNELSAINSQYQQASAGMKQVIQRLKNEPINKVLKQAHDIEKQEDAIEEQLVALLDRISTFTEESALAAEQHEFEAIRLISFVLVGTLIASLLIAYIICRSIVRPIEDMNSRLQELAQGEGDLTVRLKDTATDEMGHMAKHFNEFVSRLHTMTTKARSSTMRLFEASGSALDTMRDTTEKVVQQRAETEMVATAIEEMAATSKEVSSNTSAASTATQNIREQLNTAKSLSAQNHDDISELVTEIQQTSGVIEALLVETNNISSVLESIQSISEQTNLLALNAAIEAARAGESGRGFAVVADEVRTLAKRTQDSTGDIEGLLSRLKNEADNAVASMAKGQNKAAEVMEKSDAVTSSLDAAYVSAKEVSDLNTQIATASEEQVHVVVEINQSISNITQVAEETESGAKSTSEESQNIAGEAQNLKEVFAGFKV
ncbi:methyl-accepting chemotaxis protein [Vibrio profundum]|uniref:methyl-accepting chemotaxis protein n=1 Tax=Vibrio profundum TaxID=2910247 RepID=UPI003D0DDE12